MFVFFRGRLKTTCSQRLNNSCFYNYSPGYRTCSFQYQLNSLGSIYSPAAITVPVTIQTHKQSLPNQVPIHSCVERVDMQVKCLAQGDSATPHHPRPIPRTSQSKLVGHVVMYATENFNNDTQDAAEKKSTHGFRGQTRLAQGV